MFKMNHKTAPLTTTKKAMINKKIRPTNEVAVALKYRSIRRNKSKGEGRTQVEKMVISSQTYMILD